MPWWDVRNASGTFAVSEPNLQAAQATGTVLSGPYQTQAQAQAALSGKATSGNGQVTQAPGCGPEAIYTALLAAGFSTIQAIGAMANAINESRLNPETPPGDGGHSWGLWQFNDQSYPDAPHPTGNCAQDITRAVAYLKTHVSGQALAGNTPAEVAGNFAANFERCVGCQPGGSQYQQRVANAATVAGWVASGHWPSSSGGSAGGGGGGGSGGSLATQAVALTASSTRCLVGGSGVIPCLLDASQARGIIGGLCLLAGGLVFGVGVILVVAQSGAGQASVKAAASLTPVGRVASAATGGAKRRSAKEELTAERTGYRNEQLRARRAKGRAAAKAGQKSP